MERKILVVDDEELILHLFYEIFSRFGYRVQPADSAEKALQIMEKELFPVIFVDHHLPGMSGRDLCQIIRHKQWNCIIYSITGGPGNRQTIGTGFDDYFEKPFRLDTVVRAAEAGFTKLNGPSWPGFHPYHSDRQRGSWGYERKLSEEGKRVPHDEQG